MSKCPYTWVKSFFKTNTNSEIASFLRVKVMREGDTKVDVSLPARSAGWLIDLIPGDVVAKIKEEGIPLEEIQTDLARRDSYVPQPVFSLEEPHRVVTVWLE